jgi:lysophospholipid acyltransferase 5
MSGIGYRKDAKAGKISWDAVRQADLPVFFFARSHQDLIRSFNINTNKWVMMFVFKRLRFVGIRMVSHFAALLFLAVWHGAYTGYFTCFAYEFLVMQVEKPLVAKLDSSSLVAYLRSKPVLKYVPDLVGTLYIRLLLGYAMTDFVLLQWHVYKPVYDNIYWFGHVFYGTLFILMKLSAMISSPKAEKKAE